MKIDVSGTAAVQVQQLVNDGVYPDHETAVREAIRFLAEVRDRQRLWNSIEAADLSIDEGLGVPLHEVDWDELWVSSTSKAANGHIPDSDVTPD